MALDYKQAGVDIAAGDALVDWLKGQSADKQPHQERLVSGIGGFSALFKADFPEMKSPCLVSATDGVGTKLKLAVEFDRYDTIGQDLVAMCVNDLICCGAQPLFFLDYYATGKLDLEIAKPFLSGVQKACKESQCALIGGETAEMPGVYHGKDFDCAGFSVGIVDQEKTLGAHKVVAGDRLVGLASSGFHSNGYSLLRKVFAEDAKEFADELLTPTTLYVAVVQSILQSTDHVHAIAHITGGGMDNLLRVLPDEMLAELNPWPTPALVELVKNRTGLSQQEMMVTFNCGIGLVIVAKAEAVPLIQKQALAFQIEAFDLGEVVATPGEEKRWKL